ncbi:MAG: hypothetical protein ACR2PC_17195, partial [Tsuneonella suprasediminis]
SPSAPRNDEGGIRAIVRASHWRDGLTSEPSLLSAFVPSCDTLSPNASAHHDGCSGGEVRSMDCHVAFGSSQ